MTTPPDDPEEFLEQLGSEVSRLEQVLMRQRDELRTELRSVEAQLARATAARLALAGETSLPSTEEGPNAGRRRRLRSKERQDRIMAWAQARGDWWTIRELADDLDVSHQKLAPSVGHLTERGELERTYTEPPQYRVRGAVSTA